MPFVSFASFLSFVRVAILLLVAPAMLVGAAGCNRDTSPTGPSDDGVIVYAALGASDASGVGGSVPCVPFDPDCPNGTGYVYVVKRRMQSDGFEVQLANRGVPGYVLSQAFLTLSRDIGRNDILGTLIDQEAPFIPVEATHISIFAGGNDANLIAQAIRAGRGSADVRAYVDQQVQQFGTDLQQLIGALRAKAPNARIVAFNLPNLAAAPYVARLSGTERGILQRIAVGIADRLNALTAQSVPVVDLMCDSRIYLPSSYSSDGFHPSDSGYAVMADLLYPALRNGTAPAPSPNCPQRTIAPVF